MAERQFQDLITSSQKIWIYDANGSCKDEKSFDVTITKSPNAGTTTNFSICEGGSVTEELLNASITGNDAGSWNATSGGAGTYTYTVPATSPCTTDAKVTVEVTEQAAPNAGTTTDFSICEGGSVTEELLNASITGNDAGSWNATSGGAGTYTYTVPATSPCTTDAKVTVEVTEQAAPNAGTTTDFSICEGGSVTEELLNASITGNDAGSWNATSGGAGTYTYTVPATSPCTTDAKVTVEVTEQAAPNAGTTTDFSICEGGSVTEELLNASITGNDAGSWNATSGGAGTYTYTVPATSPCTTDAKVTVEVTEQAAPNAGTTTDFSICEGGSVTEELLNASITGNDAGSWNATSGGAGTYTYTVPATSPCTTDAKVTVEVTEQAAPNAGTTTDFSICEGGSVTEELLNASITGNDAGSWNATSGGAGTYTYTVSATSPCTTDAKVTVEVTEQAAPNAGTDTSLTVCEGTEITNELIIRSINWCRCWGNLDGSC